MLDLIDVKSSLLMAQKQSAQQQESHFNQKKLRDT
jgi:hypothetical protein